MMNYRIREAEIADAERILEIYAPYITDTTITFEYEVPDLDSFTKRMKSIKDKFPYLVCEMDGIVVGYAYASSYMERAAYDWAVDLSIYMDEKTAGKGIGSILYEALFEVLEKMHIQNLYAVITGSNEKSIGFHKKLGFEYFAFYKNVGYKHNQWLSVTWMEKFLSGHESPPVPVAWIRDINEENIHQILKKYTEVLNELFIRSTAEGRHT